MSSDVQLTRLDALLEVTSSKRIHMADYVKTGVPFYRSKEVIERSKGNKITTELFISREQFDLIQRKFGHPQDGDILITSVGTLGVPYLVQGDGDFYFKDGNLTWMRNFTHKISSRFLYYWLTSPLIQQKLDDVSIGSTQKALTITALKSLKISLPVREVQDEIVEILDSIDHRISLLRETNATFEAIAQALFKSWFVDFDPVHAKQEGRDPEGMESVIAALFPNSFEESELGLIPKGWQVGKVEQSLELAYGKALKASDRTVGPIPVYGSGGVTGYHNQALVKVPSIVIGRKGTVGSLYWEDRPFFPIDTVFYVKTKKPLTYCFYQLQRLGLEGMNTDGAVPGLNRNNVYRLPIVLPPYEVLMAFDEIVSPLRQKIFANSEQAQTLTALRDTLLPRLISGQLRLPDAEALVEETA
ncbi:MAG: restriction endonuclease subunit S [Desulfobulbus sp.]|nr:restriction endonuclease subunit S [Desulfobulbus sp.]